MDKLKEIPKEDSQSQKILRGLDLKDYRVVPDFDLKSRIIEDNQESSGTNLLENKSAIPKNKKGL